MICIKGINILQLKYFALVILVAVISSFLTAFLLKLDTKAFAAKPAVHGYISDVEVVWNTATAAPSPSGDGSFVSVNVNCPLGKIALGGGGTAELTGSGNIARSLPVGSDIYPAGSTLDMGSTLIGATGWELNIRGQYTGPETAYVICGKVNR